MPSPSSPNARPSPPSPPGRPSASSGTPQRNQGERGERGQEDARRETAQDREQAQTQGQSGAGAPTDQQPNSQRNQSGDAGQTADAQPANQDAEGQSGDDGWETSNELPQVLGDLASEGRDGPSAGNNSAEGQEEQGGEAGAGEDLAEAGQREGGDEQNGGSRTAADGEGDAGDVLRRALEDLDGEIRDERVAATDRPPGRPAPVATGDGQAASEGGQEEDGGDGQGASNSGGGAMPGRGVAASSMPPTPRPPLPQTPDTPDARDDDVVARQLREAAMAETDPELREALWEELERYKSGLQRRR